MRGVLAGLARGYAWGWRIREALYRHGILPVYRLPVPVICVGNLTTGGTGKTPLVMLLARWFQARGWRVGVISRGYRARPPLPVTVVSEGQGPLVSPREAGDEAYLLACRLPGVVVLIGRDRYRVGLSALMQYAPQVLILDDGFQHLALARDLNLLLLDASRPLEEEALLPAGHLREPLEGIRRADALVLTRWEQVRAPQRWELFLERVAPGVPRFRIRYRPVGLWQPVTGEIRDPARLRGQPVVALCGIARPEAFRRTLEDLGARMVAMEAYPDHHSFRPEEVEAFSRLLGQHPQALGVTTEKDWVRLQGRWPREVPLWVLRIEVEGEPGEGFLTWVVRHLEKKKEQMGGRGAA